MVNYPVCYWSRTKNSQILCRHTYIIIIADKTAIFENDLFKVQVPIVGTQYLIRVITLQSSPFFLALSPFDQLYYDIANMYYMPSPLLIIKVNGLYFRSKLIERVAQSLAIE